MSSAPFLVTSPLGPAMARLLRGEAPVIPAGQVLDHANEALDIEGLGPVKVAAPSDKGPTGVGSGVHPNQLGPLSLPPRA